MTTTNSEDFKDEDASVSARVLYSDRHEWRPLSYKGTKRMF